MSAYLKLTVEEKSLGKISEALIKVGYKWNYVTTIIDLADRKIIARTLSQDMTTDNTIYKAWLKAKEKRVCSS